MNRLDIRKIRAFNQMVLDKKFKSDNQISCRAWIAKIDNKWYWGGTLSTYRLTQ